MRPVKVSEKAPAPAARVIVPAATERVQARRRKSAAARRERAAPFRRFTAEEAAICRVTRATLRLLRAAQAAVDDVVSRMPRSLRSRAKVTVAGMPAHR